MRPSLRIFNATPTSRRDVRDRFSFHCLPKLVELFILRCLVREIYLLLFHRSPFVKFVFVRRHVGRPLSPT